MKALILIDDRPLRKLAFSRAEKLIQKIDQLERDLDAFNKHDQQLFSSWYELTFRTERRRMAERQDAFRALAKFHNWIIGLSTLLDISLPKAYAILREEEAEYAQGTDQTRAQIDETRKKRDEEIRERYEKEHRAARDDDALDDDLDNRVEPRNPEEEAELEALRQLSDMKLRAICVEREAAFGLLAMILSFARTPADHALFIRVWGVVPQKHQATFAKNFLKEMGFPIARMIEEFKRRASQQPPADDENGESEFTDDFIGMRPKRAAVDHEATKIVYRKLVRHLHPDLQTGQDGQSHWQKQIWHRVQAAYARNDQRELEKTYRLVLIRGRFLDELSVSEILESQNWLKDEFDQLAREAQELRRRPAWGFSKKKDYASVKRKLEKPMKAELEEIDAKIRELQAEHAYLERLSEMPAREDRQRRKRKKAQRRGGRRR